MADKESQFYKEYQALKVDQPLGAFYVISITAKELLSLSFSEPMQYVDEQGNVRGSQRQKDPKRLVEIGKYIDSVEMAFPNSIILAANYTKNGVVTKDHDLRWSVVEDPGCGIYRIRIPKNLPMAAIIDGQHRLTAFKHVTNSDRFDKLQLLCSIYFDLPNSYQAFLFATINSNQKRVDRSLALEQFGYNVGEEAESAWTPEKFAVFLSRRLNTDKERSPFYQHIKVAPLNSQALFKDGVSASWVVSTATVVDGIVSLISTNPKRDRIEMQQKNFLTGRNRQMLLKFQSDNSPLRNLFLTLKDQTIYDVIINYFKVINELFWSKSSENSYIFKTVGVQASFDILKLILKVDNSIPPNSIDFNTWLSKASGIDFSDKFFQASGIGRSRIKKAIGLAIGITKESDLKQNDVLFYKAILAGRDTASVREIPIWEEDAETAILEALERVQWDFASRTVTLLDNFEFEDSITLDSYPKLLQKLELIGETAFVTSLPSDNEFAEAQREQFDMEELVQSCLSEYGANLKKIGWS